LGIQKGDGIMISKKDIHSMPITFIVAPLVLGSLIFVVFFTYNEVIAEKEYIVTLSCMELEQYAEEQVIESKKYFGHGAYLSYAEELYQRLC
jgi:hypothetical protein